MTSQDNLDKLNSFATTLDHDRSRICNSAVVFWESYVPEWVKEVVSARSEVTEGKSDSELVALKDAVAAFVSAQAPLLRSALDAELSSQVESQKDEDYPGSAAESLTRRIVEIFEPPITGIADLLKEHGYQHLGVRIRHLDFVSGASVFPDDFVTATKEWGQKMDELMRISRTYNASVRAESRASAASRWDAI